MIGADFQEGKIRSRSFGPLEDVSKRDPDFNFFSVARASDGKEVCTYMSNYATPIVADDLMFLGLWYGPMHGCEQVAFLVPEVNGPGVAVIEKMRSHGYPRIWVGRSWDKIANAFTEQVGFRTTPGPGGTRKLLISGLQEEVYEGGERIACIRTATHMAAMSVNKQGKDEAPPGAHDDGAFARALCLRGLIALEPSWKRERQRKREQAEEARGRREGDPYSRWVGETVDALDEIHEEGDLNEVDRDLEW